MSRRTVEPGRIIDISTPLTGELAGWPGDTPFQFDLAWARASGASVNVGRITTSLHTGTHIDAPRHFEDAGPTVDQLNLATFIGPARVIDVRGLDPIPARVLPDLDWSEPTRILFRTDAWLDRSRFPTSIPTLAPEVPELLASLGVVLAGFDLPSVDVLDSQDLPIHHALSRAKIAILEGLDLTQASPGVYELIALPLPIVGGDGALVRAVLRAQPPISTR